MEEIITKTKLFAEEIRQTEVYQNYKEIELRIKDKTNLLERVEEFRRKSFEIQISHRYGHYNSYEQILALKNENMDLLSEPIVKSFLDAEVKLTKLLAKVYSTMADEIEFDVDFLLR